MKRLKKNYENNNRIWRGGRPPLFFNECFKLFKRLLLLFLWNASTKCTLCRIPVTFQDFEKKRGCSMKNFAFFKAYHAKLVPYLVEIFNTDETTTERFLNNNHPYSDRDWNTREKCWLGVKKSIEYIKYLKEINGENNILILCIINNIFVT